MFSTMEDLRQECLKCQKCPLHETRTNVVFGVGKPDAKILFIGEAPGENEDLQGEPFVGRGGKLLDLYLGGIGLDRKENIYIANMLKCRPPKNRDPKPEEMDMCIDWLRELVRIMRPQIIVCVGRIAAQRLISPDFRVTKDHGIFYNKNGTLMMGTFHPAALLRDPRKKGDCLEDFLKLQDKIKELGIEI
ncbi:MAG: uracil-DNA glycosylase [Clostridia bacterium]|nr:uracil-DNA glycosylase [Oscillospiraceae bacterium]MBR2410828.1 uracil-DNA glycosylase [Clostridia bacterium]